MQFLVRLTDNSEAINNSKKRGDVIAMLPDSHEFSPWEKLPHFLIVKTSEEDSACVKYLECLVEEKTITINILKAHWDEDKDGLADESPYMCFIRKPTPGDVVVGDDGFERISLSGHRYEIVEKKLRLNLDGLMDEKGLTINELNLSEVFTEIIVDPATNWIDTQNV
ncbi:MAG: hypothetical protein DRH26_03455 [Deltaproteobacteria bacterium]|nr:MAG: hypothetical protein DRH26_03455 [Deltaproteobacteria bacterium]